VRRRQQFEAGVQISSRKAFQCWRELIG
jgi:hypothetical protein